MATLADLYDRTTMPHALTKAHHADLDRAVDCCERKELFLNGRAREEHLLALSRKLSAPLAPAAKKAKKAK